MHNSARRTDRGRVLSHRIASLLLHRTEYTSFSFPFRRTVFSITAPTYLPTYTYVTAHDTLALCFPFVRFVPVCRSREF